MECCKLLIEHGCPIDTRDKYGLTAIHLASYEGHAEIVEFLLSKNLSVNSTDCKGRSALTHCCRKGNIQTLEILISHGANVNITDELGDTPLIIASRRGKEDFKKLLLLAGAQTPPITESNQVVLVEQSTSLSLKDRFTRIPNSSAASPSGISLQTKDQPLDNDLRLAIDLIPKEINKDLIIPTVEKPFKFTMKKPLETSLAIVSDKNFKPNASNASGLPSTKVETIAKVNSTSLTSYGSLHEDKENAIHISPRNPPISDEHVLIPFKSSSTLPVPLKGILKKPGTKSSAMKTGVVHSKISVTNAYPKKTSLVENKSIASPFGKEERKGTLIQLEELNENLLHINMDISLLRERLTLGSVLMQFVSNDIVNHNNNNGDNSSTSNNTEIGHRMTHNRDFSNFKNLHHSPNLYYRIDNFIGTLALFGIGIGLSLFYLDSYI